MQKQGLCLDDECYDITNQLSRTLNFLSRVDQYVEDANRCGDPEVAKVWNTIKSDREKHAELLKGLIYSRVKSDKF